MSWSLGLTKDRSTALDLGPRVEPGDAGEDHLPDYLHLATDHLPHLPRQPLPGLGLLLPDPVENQIVPQVGLKLVHFFLNVLHQKSHLLDVTLAPLLLHKELVYEMFDLNKPA